MEYCRPVLVTSWVLYPNPTIAINIVDIVVYPAAIGDQFETQYIVRLENPFFEGIEAYLVSIGLFRLEGGIDAGVADL